MHELFAAQAARDAGRRWRSCWRGRGADLRRAGRAGHRLAHHLRGLGVGPRRWSGSAFERSPELVVALLGVLQGRRRLPAARPRAIRPSGWRSCSTDAGAAAVLLTGAARRPAAGGAGGGARALDDLEEACARRADAASRRGWPESLAYVIYTSGSTGRPKGVAGRATARLVNLLRWRRGGVRLGAGRPRCLQIRLASFDVVGRARSSRRWLPAAPCCIAGRRTPLDPGAACAALEQRAGSPSPQRAVRSGRGAAPAARAGARALAAAPLLVGGEPLAERAGARRCELRPPGRLVNVYGPTEATVPAPRSALAAAEPPARRYRRSAGRWPTAPVYVLDGGLAARARGRAGRALHRRRRPGARLPAAGRS